MNLRTFLPVALSLIIFPLFSNAQTWQWAKQGGDVADGINSTPFENVWDMATDPRGNVYVLSVIEGSNTPKVDGRALTPYNDKDVLLSSYTSTGTYRWSKHIGGWGNDAYNYSKHGLKIDNAGRIYVCGYIAPPPGSSPASRFDTDLTLPAGQIKTAFLLQYDTTGALKWLRMPDPDTTTSKRAIAFDMDIDDNGNVYMITFLRPGKLADGNFVINADGLYLLRYNPQGTITGVTKLQAQSTLYTGVYMRLSRNKANGSFYLNGLYAGNGGTFVLGSRSFTFIENFIAGFDSSGTNLWVKAGNMPVESRIAIDVRGDIYIAGSMVGNTIGYNNYYAANVVNGKFVPFVMKLSPAGNTIWATNGSSDQHTNCNDFMLYNNRVYITGEYWGNFSIGNFGKVRSGTPNGNADIYLASLSTRDGSVLSIDTVYNMSGQESPWKLASDKRNNIYMGGYFTGGGTLGSSTLSKYGGYADFFVAKYGYNNTGCTTPTAAFGHNTTSGSNTVSFTYTGTSPYDSVSWDFGDGNYSSATNPVYTFSGKGNHLVCVTVFTNCGSDTKCQGVAALDVEDQALSQLRIHPNPATDVLIIENDAAATASYRIMNIVGSKLLEGHLRQGTHSIDIRQIPTGMYLAEIVMNGQRQVLQWVKQ